ncbi:Membrane protein involved in the export of O-antigen and teichoic acid [Bosea sp. OK403]|uniref:oligosaccharide flippase family protein n=1 Tax=Bosea sp. OK403 TaxID=1855286 RepID=UPI0008ED89DB|nr:lipopolysaccharide biosynthesis protein [Bosea sp. OK403]SFJ61477.1 Membrane protein involved in the export of O-antigen and teichoic acid [Bosea sp. OK403]
MSDRFARNSLFSTVAGIGTALSSLLSMVLVSRLLGPSEAGTVAYALWIATLAVTFADFGIYQSLTRYLPELTARGDDHAAWGLAAFLLRPCLILAALGLAVFVWRGGTAIDEPGAALPPRMWWLIGLLFTSQLVSSFGLGLLRGFQRFDKAARLTLSSLVVQLMAVAAGAVLGGAGGALLGYCAGNLLPIAMILRRELLHGRIGPALRGRVLKFALYSWAGALTVAMVWSRLEIFFLARYHGSEAVALYTAGLTFSNLASQGPLLLTGGLLPYFSERIAENSLQQLNSSYATATRVMAFLLFPICLGLAAILPALLPLVYGPAFVAAIPSASILVAGAAFGASGAVGSQMIYARERSDFVFFSGIAGAILSVAAYAIVIPVYGLEGGAWARAGIHIFMVAFGSWFIWRRLACPIPLLSIAKIFLAAACCAVAAHLCVRLIANPLLSLPTALISGALVYSLCVRWLRALPSQDLTRLSGLLGRLPVMARIPAIGCLALLSSERI